MQQVFRGPPDDAEQAVRALGTLGITRLGFTRDALGQVTVLVDDDDADEARVLLRALDDLTVLAARRRVYDAIAFRGGREVGGVA